MISNNDSVSVELVYQENIKAFDVMLAPAFNNELCVAILMGNSTRDWFDNHDFL